MNIKSNSSEGDLFLLEMMRIEDRWQKARELFTDFIQKNGFSAWHIHNGWVKMNCLGGKINDCETVEIVWIDQQAGYSHTIKCPEVDEKVVVLKDSPDGEEFEPFELYCFVVVGKTNIFSCEEIILRRVEIKQCVLNRDSQSYEFYKQKKRKLFINWKTCWIK